MNRLLFFFLGALLSLINQNVVAEDAENEAGNAVIPCNGAVAAVDKIVEKVTHTQNPDAQRAYAQSIIFISELTEECTEIANRKVEAENVIAHTKTLNLDDFAKTYNALCPNGKCAIDITEDSDPITVTGHQIPDYNLKIDNIYKNTKDIKNSLIQNNSLQKPLSQGATLQQAH
ncbi:hypothetical protein [Pseudomonas gozinkensis]|uniref:hypothetical protein n=1 Tax=Pseudomonas gozinkensis TaxID=2774461 RepID=UPI0017883ACB|nr:hypothetical protein [Pseudomonas gozinkensis]